MIHITKISNGWIIEEEQQLNGLLVSIEGTKTFYKTLEESMQSLSKKYD